MDELKELLLKVSDSYRDFVIGVCGAVKSRDDGVELMIEFIREHPEAKSDDIIDKLEEYGM